MQHLRRWLAAFLTCLGICCLDAAARIDLNEDGKGDAYGR